MEAKKAKEAQALSAFRERLQDVMKPDYDDVYLRKWLKARNFDVDKAEMMFRTSLEYKKKMKVDTLLDTYQVPEVIQKYLPGGFCGYDKEGSPVLIELYGDMDFKGLLYSARKEDIEKTKLLLGEQVMKMLKEQSQKLGRLVEGMTVILDLKNVGASMLWGPGMQMIAHMGKVVQDNYPEVVKRTYIVNAPRIFPMLWTMMRPLITEEMKSKVCILGGDFKKELLKQIEPDQLPAFLGGTLTDPDGNKQCVTMVCPGGTVPEEYYLKELTSTDHLKTNSIPKGDKLEIVYKVPEKMSVLRWEFKTDGYDIGFGLLLEHTASNRETVLPVTRVNSHLSTESGTYTCVQPGLYVLVFDNTYSWARSKTLFYGVDIIPPAEETTVTQDLNQVTLGGDWGRVAEETVCTHL